MSSVSCMLLQNPSSIFGMRDDMKMDDYNVRSAVMWTLGSLLGSFSVDMSNNNSGILVSVTILNVLLMLLATILLGKGLKESNATYVVPWLMISFWTMYQIQLRDILKLYKSLTDIRTYNNLPWCALGAYAISLLVRFQLTLSVCYVALQQWYNKKLSQEVKESLAT